MSVNIHTHLGVEILKDYYFLVKIIIDAHHKNNIISIKENIYDYTSKHGTNAICIFQTLSYLINIYAKRVWNKRQPCLTLIFHLISSNKLSVVLNSRITFLCIIIIETLNLRGTIIYSFPFHCLVQGMVLNTYLMLTRKLKRLVLLL